MFEIKGKYTTAKVFIDSVEPSCVSQITDMVNHPAFTNPIAIMPDTHAGMGSVIGFTMPISDQVIPSVVGVDIGCGVLSFNVGKDIFKHITHARLDQLIREAVPFGHAIRDPSKVPIKNFPWKEISLQSLLVSRQIEKKWGICIDPVIYSEEWLKEKSKQINANYSRVIGSIGTLGGGNHYCEIGESQNTGDYWVSIHSGSRNFGLKICEYWQKQARSIINDVSKNELDQKIRAIRDTTRDRNQIPGKIRALRESVGLGGVSTKKNMEALFLRHMFGYLMDMLFAQHYASVNRYAMAHAIERILNVFGRDEIDTVHNYIDFSDMIIRKGAIKSYKDQKMVIPLNMRDGTLLCVGKSNPEWNYSAPHGAGRIMGRSQAKRELDVDVFKQEMQGIFSTSVGQSTLDEAPGAYKDSKMIEDAIGPTATILDRWIPVLNMKSG